MRRIHQRLAISCLTLAGLLAVTLLEPATAQAKLRVVTTLTDLAAMTREVGGPHVQVVSLVPADQDPHYVDPRPNLMLPLARADLLIVNGLALEEGWLRPLIRGSRNAKIQAVNRGYLDVSFFVQRLQVPTTRVNRGMGDIHPGGNPHFTHDPRAAVVVSRAIGDRLALIDPVNAKTYKARAVAFSAKLTAFSKSQRARFTKLPKAKRKVVSYHLSLSYVYQWLGLTEVINVEPRPGIPPNPSHTARVLSTMRATGAKTIIQEPFYPRSVSKTLSRLAKGALVVIPGGTNERRKESYLARLQRMTDGIYKALIR